MKHVEGEEEDDMPATNLSKLICLKTEDEKVCGCVCERGMGVRGAAPCAMDNQGYFRTCERWGEVLPGVRWPAKAIWKVF